MSWDRDYDNLGAETCIIVEHKGDVSTFHVHSRRHNDYVYLQNSNKTVHIYRETGPYSPAFLSMISRNGPSSRVNAGASSAATFNFGADASLR